MLLVHKTPVHGKTYLILETPGWSYVMLGPVLGHGERQAEDTSGEILPAHIYCKEEKWWCGLFLGLVFLGW
jgi:hypothetical protein